MTRVTTLTADHEGHYHQYGEEDFHAFPCLRCFYDLEKDVTPEFSFFQNIAKAHTMCGEKKRAAIATRFQNPMKD